MVYTFHMITEKSDGVAARLASGRFRFLPFHRFSGYIGLPRLNQYQRRREGCDISYPHKYFFSALPDFR